MARVQLVLLMVMLACSLVATETQAARPSPQCSGASTAPGITLENIILQCHSLVPREDRFMSVMGLGEVKKLDFVELCSCALLNHELAWASIMTPNANVLYRATMDFINYRIRYDTLFSALWRSGEGGTLKEEEEDRYLLWKALDYILSQATGVNDDEKIAMQMLSNVAKLYVDLETFESSFTGLDKDHSEKLTLLVSEVCNAIFIKFAKPFLGLFEQLNDLARDRSLFYTLTTYNEDLYKLRINSRICSYLGDHGYLRGS